VPVWQRQEIQAVPRPASLDTDGLLTAAPRRFQTDRLLLEAPRVEHAQAFADLLNASVGSWSFINWGLVPRDLVWAHAFCLHGAELVDAGKDLIFNVFDPNTGACIGRIDLHSFDFEAPRCEIGYVGDPRVSGQGLMREAVLAVIKLGFSLGLARIEAFSDVHNHRALHFAQGLGFEREGVVRHRERNPQGELCSQVMMAVFPPPRSPG
jgi:RimJ/RimL family protein N-acetyltransferase